MTWIRVDTKLPSEPVIGKLCEVLKLKVPEAVGIFVCVQLGLGEHQKDGSIDSVSDTTIEDWARWKGRAGQLAAAIREHCVEREGGMKDAPGVMTGWWRNIGPLTKQLRDAQRPYGGEDAPDDPPPRGGQSHEKPARESRGDRAGKGSDVNAAAEAARARSTSAAAGAGAALAVAMVGSLEYVRRCVGMANRGLRDNPAFKQLRRGFNELTCSSQDAQLEWMKEGIPVEIAERAIYQRAVVYRPTATRPQPGGLAYFGNAVREAHERALADAAAAGIAIPSPSGNGATQPLTDAERYARQLEEEERRESGEGVQHA